MSDPLQSSEADASSTENMVPSSIESREGMLGQVSNEPGEKHCEQVEQPEAGPVTGLRRLVFLTLAGFFFVLGAAGAILPGLPTTPFLLLTSYFLVKSSPRLNAMLLQSPMFGPILQDWQERKGVRRDVKFQAVAMVTLLAGISIYVSLPSIVISGMISFGALIGILVILRLPEIPARPEKTTEEY